MSLRLGLFLLVLTISVVMAACDESPEEDPADDLLQRTGPHASEKPSPVTTAPPSPGRTYTWPQAYETPILRAEGYYFPPAYDPANTGENRAADERIASLPKFYDTIGGFLFFETRTYERTWPCLDSEASGDAVEADEVPFGVSYFLPGTIEEGKALLRLCPDGSVYYSVRGFRVGPSAFAVAYTGGELSIPNDDFRVGHVKETTLHGRTGIIVEPYNSFGLGGSMAAWPSGDGYMSVRANGLPLEELIKIVGGVTCADCSTVK